MKLGRYLSEHEISPREFAAKLGISAEAVRLYVEGERTPRKAIMQSIASLTEGAVTANDFFMPEAAQ